MMQPGGRGNLVHLFQVQTKIYDVTCGLSTQLCPHSQTVVFHIRFEGFAGGRVTHQCE